MWRVSNLQTRSRTSLHFELKAMKEKHFDLVLAIEKLVFSNPWRRQDFQNALEKEGSDGIVALMEGQVVGYVLGFKVLNEFHLADFAVHPNLQNRGFGWGFLNRLLGRLDNQGIQVVSLEVRVSNYHAIGLYRKAGFQNVAIHKNYYSRPREDAFLMLKSLRGNLSDWVEELFLGSSKGKLGFNLYKGVACLSQE